MSLNPEALRRLADVLEEAERIKADLGLVVPTVAPSGPRHVGVVIAKWPRSAKPMKPSRRKQADLSEEEREANRVRWRAAQLAARARREAKGTARRRGAAKTASEAAAPRPNENASPGAAEDVPRAPGFLDQAVAERAKRWSYSQLAQASNVSQATIRDALAGRLTPALVLDAIEAGVAALEAAVLRVAG